MIMDGVININKPAGWTSQDVCAKLKRALHVKKAGHTGTLDPMATGVLPVCVGKATRVIEYYGNDSKSYHCCMKLGIETDTLDMTGKALKTGSYAEVTEKAVREAFKAFDGVIEQTPPKYSALMIDGKRAYDLARAGEDFEIKPRKVTVYDSALTLIDLENGEIEFDVTCSKGTYIRSICDDMGKALGCGAAMSALTRTASGSFKIEDSYTIEEVISAAEDAGSIEKMIIPADITLEKLGIAILDDNRVTAFTNGNSTWSDGFTVTEPSGFDELYRVYAHRSDPGSESNCKPLFLGVASIENGSLIPQKVLHHG